MTEKQFWSRKDICKLFHKAYTHKDVYKHSDQTEGIEILEELFGLDIYSKDYKIWNSDDELIGLDGNESKKFNLAYESGEWWAVRDGDILFWKEEVVALLNELHEENVQLQGKYDAQKQLYCQLNSDKNNIWQDYQDLKKENEELKQELFESEVDYCIETYRDNPVRADNHITNLKEEFKERFKREFEYEGK